MGILEVENLDKSYGGVKAINGLSFSVEEGMVFSVIGPNGAGKTTLFNLLTGVDRPDSGSIRFNGQELIGKGAHHIASAGMARTFQNLQVFLNMSVIENVMVGCHLRAKIGMFSAVLRLPSVLREEKRIRAWAMETLKFCDMESMADAPASALPYGALKKLEIARALALRPQLILLDEPAAGLNDTETLEMGRLIQGICDSGVTVLLVEHNMGLVMEISSHVLVLNYGQLLAQGPPSKVQKDPLVIAAYLGEESDL